MRTALKTLCAAVILTGAVIAPVHAQETPPAQTQEEKVEQAIDTLARHAHDALANAKLSDGSLIGEEKAKTLVYPLVPRDIIKTVVARGHITGFAAHCNLDWEKEFFLPTMTQLRKAHPEYDDYQMAFIGVLHGISMSNAEQSQKDKPCTEEMKAKLLALVRKGE